MKKPKHPPIVKLQAVRNRNDRRSPNPIITIADATIFGALALAAAISISMSHGVNIFALLFGG